MDEKEVLKRIEEAARAGATELIMSNEGLRSLPAEIGRLTNLKALNLEGNQLAGLPAEIGELTNLNHLNLSNNLLAGVPAEIGLLTNLKELDLSRNLLSGVPAEIGRLTNLTGLYLQGNQLTGVPAEIGRLTNLTVLDLSGNELTSLPEEIRNLKKLKGLFLHGNDELGIPPEVLGPRWHEILKAKPAARPVDILEYYFRGREEDRRELREAKVLLVGQGGVGKTSLVKRLIDNQFDPEEDKTGGINIRGWEAQGKEREGGKRAKIALNVWDFGGQEIMHATHQFFLTKRSLYILVLDARKGENECNIQYWLKIIQSFGGDSAVLVVVNKCDQEILELNENRLRKDYAPNIKGFLNTSCETGEGIEELKAAIEKEVNELEHVYDVLPKSYFDIKGVLEKRAEDEDFIEIEEYRQLCQEHGVTKESEQDLLLRFLHDLGNVLNFGDPDDPYNLEDTNVLNPKWVTEGVYKIINDKGLKKQDEKGVLVINDVGKILDDAKYGSRERQGFIVDMMRKFELCFDFPGGFRKRVLIPELLGVNEPNIDWDKENALNFEYHYSVLPGGLMCRFIVRMHSKVKKHRVYWRSGVLMEMGANTALVRGDCETGKVFISVAGAEEGRRDALSVIRKEFKSIHATIPRLEVKGKVPLAGERGVEVDYEHLLQLEEMGIEELVPEGTKRKYEVKKLLDGIQKRFDVFLCHNSADKDGVKEIGGRLKEAGFRVWLDEWELRPGLAWVPELEKQIESVKSAAVFVGDNGIGPWERMEVNAFLLEFVNRKCPVIPVILKDCTNVPELPVFLKGMAWVDFREARPDPMEQLIWGIRGRKVGI